MTIAARARRFYWKQIRGYDSETCGDPAHRHEAIRHGCGRRVGVVWGTSAGIWNFVVTGQDQTVYTLREGAAGGPVEERAEGVGGVLCLRCFDEFAQKRGVSLRWESRPLG